MRRPLVYAAILLLLAGCSSSPTQPKLAPSLAANDTPAHAVSRFLGAYEQRNEGAYAGLFTGNFQYEFSTSTDPTLVQQYSAGWFKNDETMSSTHLFSGYTPPGGATLPAAQSITIKFATTTPADDNSAGVDPTTHKVLATRIDGAIVVPQAGGETLTYVISNNYNVFYFVRGDSASGLSTSQPADSVHWYIYRWVDQSEAGLVVNGRRLETEPSTWGRVKGLYHQ